MLNIGINKQGRMCILKFRKNRKNIQNDKHFQIKLKNDFFLYILMSETKNFTKNFVHEISRRNF